MGGKSDSDSESSNVVNFNQKVWGPSGEAYQQAMGNINALFPQVQQGVDQVFGQAGNASNQANNVTNTTMPAFNQQLQGGNLAGLNAQMNPGLVNSIQKSLTGPSNTQQVYQQAMGGNPFTGAAITGVNNRLADNLYRYGIPKVDDAAVAAGQMGSSRHGIATGLVTSDTLNNMADINSQMLNNNFYKDMGMQLGIANQADNNLLSLQQSLLNQNNAQNQVQANAVQNQAPGMQNLAMGGMAPYMAATGLPVNAMGGYSSAVGDPVILGSGSATGSSSSDSKGFSLG